MPMCLRGFRTSLGLIFLLAVSFETEARPFSIAYFGETLSHPGVSAGTEWKVLGGEVHTLNLGAEGGFYVHLKNHTGLFAQATFGYRATSKLGLSGEILFGAGYLHTFLGAPVFDATGQPVFDAGRPHFMPSLSLGVAWNIPHANGRPIAPFLRFTLFGQFPYNNGLLPRAAVLVGVRFL